MSCRIDGSLPAVRVWILVVHSIAWSLKCLHYAGSTILCHIFLNWVNVVEVLIIEIPNVVKWKTCFSYISKFPDLHLDPEISCCDVFHGLFAHEQFMLEIRSYLLPFSSCPVCYLILSFMLCNLSQKEQINLVCNSMQSHEMLGILKTECVYVCMYACTHVCTVCMYTCVICIAV